MFGPRIFGRFKIAAGQNSAKTIWSRLPKSATLDDGNQSLRRETKGKKTVNRALWLMIGLGFAGVFLESPVSEGPRTAAAQESGSAERPRPFSLPIPFRLPHAESGSGERTGPNGPLPFDPFPSESGSTERPGRILPQEPGPNGQGGPQARGPSVTPPRRKSSPGFSAPPSGNDTPLVIQSEASSLDLITAAVILVAGFLFVGWLLFRLGMFNPYAASLWPKRLELCIEIALRIDDFLTAAREGNFEKCQMSLDALNHLNGRRSILLSNRINAAVNQFIRYAVDAKVSKDDEDYQKNLNRQYERVIEALRVGTRQEELSLDVLESLTKAQGSHRRLRDDAKQEET